MLENITSLNTTLLFQAFIGAIILSFVGYIYKSWQLSRRVVRDYDNNRKTKLWFMLKVFFGSLVVIYVYLYATEPEVKAILENQHVVVEAQQPILETAIENIAMEVPVEIEPVVEALPLEEVLEVPAQAAANFDTESVSSGEQVIGEIFRKKKTTPKFRRGLAM